jgi:hypothetical protein
MAARKRKPTRKKTVVKTPSLLDLFPGHRKAAYIKRASEVLAKSLSELARAYRHRGLVLYIGAGVPRSAGLPGWADLVRALTVRMMTRKVETAISALGELQDEARWQLFDELYEDLQVNQPSDKPILMLARSLKDQFADHLPDEIARILYRRFYLRSKAKIRQQRGASIELFQTGSLTKYPLLEAVAALARAERDAKGVQAIVNYNFDDLLEEYLKAQNIKCMPVLSGGDKVADGVLPSYHVHGLIRSSEYLAWSFGGQRVRARGNFVFSEDEYHAEYSDPYRWSNMTQMSHLGRYTGMFIGLSMEDPNIRRLIDVTHRQYPETRNFAILPRRKSLIRSKDDQRALLRNLFEEVETTSFERIGVGVLWVDHYEDIPKLLTRITVEAVA